MLYYIYRKKEINMERTYLLVSAYDTESQMPFYKVCETEAEAEEVRADLYLDCFADLILVQTIPESLVYHGYEGLGLCYVEYLRWDAAT